MLLLLAINIFPLLWTIQLSFTNYRANRPNAPISYVGLDNYRDILTDPDVWYAMQATAHFVLWSIALELILGFGLALLINRGESCKADRGQLTPKQLEKGGRDEEAD